MRIEEIINLLLTIAIALTLFETIVNRKRLDIIESKLEKKKPGRPKKLKK